MLRAALLSLLLGVVAVLATSLFFAYSSVASTRTDWDVIATRGNDLANASSHTTLGKTIVSWRPLPDHERAELDRNGSLGPAGLTRGPQRPPSWSSFWSDAAFEDARTAKPPHANQRDDIAVGWPWRAFTCVRSSDSSFQPPAPVILGGLELPNLEGHTPGSFFDEQRAIPLRPIYAGLLLDVAAFAAASFAILLVRRRLVARQPAYSRPAASQFADAPPARTPRSIRTAVVVWLLLLGVITTAVVAILLPLVAPMRWTNLSSTTEAGSRKKVSMLWTSHLMLPPAEDPTPDSIGAARALGRVVEGQTYTGIMRDMAFSKLNYEGKIALLDAPRFFSATLTGWPMRCQWGASWSTAASATAPLASTRWNLARVPKLSVGGVILNRGLNDISTRPLWLGWIVNTLFFAACWSLVWLFLRRRTRIRRARRGLCPFCAYDLSATRAGQPCPECGATVQLPAPLASA